MNTAVAVALEVRCPQGVLLCKRVGTTVLVEGGHHTYVWTHDGLMVTCRVHGHLVFVPLDGTV